MKILFLSLAICLFVIYLLSTREDKEAREKRRPTGKLEEYWRGKDRRRVERRDTKLEVRYRCLKSPNLKSATSSKDISEDGICILAHEILPQNTILELEIAVPNRKDAIGAKGGVVWCEDTGRMSADGKRMFLMGIKFIEINDKDKAELSRFISGHSTEEERSG